MRSAIKEQVEKMTAAHFGLAYDVFAPVNSEDGKVPTGEREEWLKRLAGIKISSDYILAYERWTNSLAALGACVAEIESQTRLMIGIGNPSGSEVGLTVQHTWGTPHLPGSALKGVLQHHLVKKYGPAAELWNFHPLDPQHPDKERAGFQPAQWSERQILHTPGEAIRMIFGAPDAESDTESDWRDSDNVGAAKGSITFLDGWWKPLKSSSAQVSPFTADITNVHQRSYYGQDGKRTLPNDFGSPVPIQYMTVKPKQSFVLAVLGPQELAKWVMEELLDALSTQGMGAKTMAGYGLFEKRIGPKFQKEVITSALADEFLKVIDTSNEYRLPEANEPANQRERLEKVRELFQQSGDDLTQDQRERVAEELIKVFGKHKKLGVDARRIADEIRGNGGSRE